LVSTTSLLGWPHYPASILKFMFQPGRPVPTTSGRGRYESIADSTLVHLTEQLLRSIHQNTGLPWWASTVCTTVALRTVVTLPLGTYKVVILAKACVASRTKKHRQVVSPIL
uniref:Uncharacterized protein n=1 Tax=Oncorhynchus kisutch TaxID=8019 RepID=A0A8C7HYF9_ONCKI